MATKLSYTFEKKIDINMSTTSSSQSASSLADPSLVFAGLVIQFAITITVCLVSLIIFESLRHRLGWIYAPKFNKDTAVQKSTSLSPKKGRNNYAAHLYNPGSGWFSWIKPTLKSKDATIALVAGTDALMFSKFLGFSVRYFTILSALSLLLLIPMNTYIGYNNVDSTSSSSSSGPFTIHILSIASVVQTESNNWLLWFPALFTAVFAGIAYRLLWQLWQQYAEHRGKYFSCQDRSRRVHCRTLMITDVPRHLQNERAIKRLVDEVIKAMLGKKLALFKRHFYGNNNGDYNATDSIVEKVYVDRKIEHLARLFDAREQKLECAELELLRWIKRERANYTTTTREGNTQIKHRRSLASRIRGWLHGSPPKIKEIVCKDRVNESVGQSVSIDQLLRLGKQLGAHMDSLLCDIQQSDRSISTYRNQYNEFHHLPAENRNGSTKFERTFPTQSTVFVTLRTRMAQLLLTANDSLPVDTSKFSLLVKPAPEPRDLIWENLSISLRERLTRRVIVGTLVAMLVIFYLFPVMAIISLTDLQTLSKFIPALAHVASNTWAQALNQNVIPTIILTVCMSLLYWLLQRLSMMERPVSRSQMEFWVMTKYYYFELFNVLFAFTIGNSVFQVLSSIVDNPRNVLSILATSLPENASFFVNYVVFGVSMFAVEILNIKRVAIQYFYYFFVSVKTPRTKFHLKNQRIHIDYGLWYSLTLLIFTISITYSTIYPLIVPFAALYFMMAYLMFRYQLLYVYTPQYETGGSFFADFVFDKIILSLLIQQATMLGYLLLKQAYLAVLIVSLPTIVATVVFRNYCWSAIGKKVQTWGDNGPGLIKIMRLIESTTSKDGELENVSDGGSSSNSGTSSSSTSVSGSPKSKQKSSKDETLLDIDVLSASIQTLHDAHTEEETAFNEEYDPQTYSHPVFHHPLKQLWLPNKAADSFERAFKLNK